MDDSKPFLPSIGVAAVHPEVTNIGQVALMKLPPGFVIGNSNRPGDGSFFFQEYHLEADPEVKVYFEYRGKRMSKEASEMFYNVLAASPHSLTQAELEGLKQLLQKRSDPAAFRTMVAKTQDIRGKRVMVVEGLFLNHGLQARTLYVDSDGTGSAVQEITFQAPSTRFANNMLQGIKSLESIIWK
jgi:hypothetical protein